MKNAILFLAIGVAGAVLASSLKVPGGLLIGAMLAVSATRLAGVDLGRPPHAYSEIGKTLLGTCIGATFSRTVLARLGNLVPAAILTTLAMIGIGLILALILSRLTRLDNATALFSLTPGGMAEMVAVAQESGADVSIVATVQFLRYSSVVILAPVVIDWFFS
jgi:membrane AbrB-like protein